MSQKVVLLVEDNNDMLEIQKLILESEGHKVLTAVNGLEAFNLLKQGTIPNLIISDYQMNVMDGVELLNELDKHMPFILRDVPVIMLSAATKPSSKATMFMRKPLDLGPYIEIVNFFLKNGNFNKGVA